MIQLRRYLICYILFVILIMVGDLRWYSLPDDTHWCHVGVYCWSIVLPIRLLPMTIPLLFVLTMVCCYCSSVFFDTDTADWNFTVDWPLTLWLFRYSAIVINLFIVITYVGPVIHSDSPILVCCRHLFIIAIRRIHSDRWYYWNSIILPSTCIPIDYRLLYDLLLWIDICSYCSHSRCYYLPWRAMQLLPLQYCCRYDLIRGKGWWHLFIGIYLLLLLWFGRLIVVVWPLHSLIWWGPLVTLFIVCWYGPSLYSCLLWCDCWYYLPFIDVLLLHCSAPVILPSFVHWLWLLYPLHSGCAGISFWLFIVLFTFCWQWLMVPG